MSSHRAVPSIPSMELPPGWSFCPAPTFQSRPPSEPLPPSEVHSNPANKSQTSAQSNRHPAIPTRYPCESIDYPYPQDPNQLHPAYAMSHVQRSSSRSSKRPPQTSVLPPGPPTRSISRHSVRTSTSLSQPTLPFEGQTRTGSPFLIFHVCSVCRQPRSAHYHRDHPVREGDPPPQPTPCHACKATKPKSKSKVAEDVVFSADFVSDARQSERHQRRGRETRSASFPAQAHSQDIHFRHVDATKVTETSHFMSGALADPPVAPPWMPPPPPSQSSRSGTTATRSSTSTIKAPSVTLSDIRKIAREEIERTQSRLAPSSVPSAPPPPLTVSSAPPPPPSVPSVPQDGVGRIVVEQVHHHGDWQQVVPQPVSAAPKAPPSITRSEVRHIAHDEVKRYRHAERQIDSHPNAFTRGRFVPIEDEAEVKKQPPPQAPPSSNHTIATARTIDYNANDVQPPPPLPQRPAAPSNPPPKTARSMAYTASTSREPPAVEPPYVSSYHESYHARASPPLTARRGPSADAQAPGEYMVIERETWKEWPDEIQQDTFLERDVYYEKVPKSAPSAREPPSFTPRPQQTRPYQDQQSQRPHPAQQRERPHLEQQRERPYPEQPRERPYPESVSEESTVSSYLSGPPSDLTIYPRDTRYRTAPPARVSQEAVYEERRPQRDDRPVTSRPKDDRSVFRRVLSHIPGIPARSHHIEDDEREGFHGFSKDVEFDHVQPDEPRYYDDDYHDHGYQKVARPQPARSQSVRPQSTKPQPAHGRPRVTFASRDDVATLPPPLPSEQDSDVVGGISRMRHRPRDLDGFSGPSVDDYTYERRQHIKYVDESERPYVPEDNRPLAQALSESPGREEFLLQEDFDPAPSFAHGPFRAELSPTPSMEVNVDGDGKDRGRARDNEPTGGRQYRDAQGNEPERGRSYRAERGSELESGRSYRTERGNAERGKSAKSEDDREWTRYVKVKHYVDEKGPYTEVEEKIVYDDE